MSPVFRLPSCVPRPYPASRVPDSSSLPLSSARVSAPVASNAGSLARSGTLTASPCAGVELPVRGRTFGIRLSPLPLVRGGSPSRLIRATRDGYTQASGVYMSMSVSMSAPQTSTRTRTCGQWPVASTADAGAGDARPGCVSDSMLLLRASEGVCVRGRTCARPPRPRLCFSSLRLLGPSAFPSSLAPLYSFFPLSAPFLPSSRPPTLSHGPWPTAHTPQHTPCPRRAHVSHFPLPTSHIPKSSPLPPRCRSRSGPGLLRTRSHTAHLPRAVPSLPSLPSSSKSIHPILTTVSPLVALPPLRLPAHPLVLHLGIRAAQLVVQRGSAPHTRLFPPAPRGVGTGGVVVIIIMLAFSYPHILCGPSWRGMYVCAGRRSGEWACGGSARCMAYGTTAQRFGAGPPLPSLTKAWW